MRITIQWCIIISVKEVIAMRVYYQNVAIVLDFLNERGYAEQTIRYHELFYNKLADYLELTIQEYNPDLGRSLLLGRTGPCHTRNSLGNAACIAKLNDVYENGRITYAQISPRKEYSSIVLCEKYQELVSGFLASKPCFKDSQLTNAHRRCSLFLKYIQSKGIMNVTAITYEDLQAYHDGLSHLKRISRVVEESSLHQFLRFLAESGHTSQGLYLFMYALETETLVTMSNLTAEERGRIVESCERSSSLSAEEFLSAGSELISLFREAGYVAPYVNSVHRAIMQFYLFLDLHGLSYTDEIASVWLHSDAVRNVFQGSSWIAARRTLFMVSIFISSGQADFARAIPKGISGIDELPEWCSGPLLDFADIRRRTKIDEDTVRNDIYSILRFCKYIVSKGLSSYDEITSGDVANFNLKDVHGSPEGKNACNGRIRRFLKYLYREGLLSSPSLHLALGYSAAPVETIVVTLTADEVETIRGFIRHAVRDLEIRDSAVILLGTEMGMRGSDIVALKMQDIDWKNRAIRFCQKKTDVDAWIPMPVAVGNALFRYLRDVRPKKAKNEYVFVEPKAPYGPMTRSICYGALKRILPDRSVRGSGFHVTRKAFSTNLLRNGVRPEEIADVIGHSGTKNLDCYLSLDDERMALCPLSIADLMIQAEGGAP